MTNITLNENTAKKELNRGKENRQKLIELSNEAKELAKKAGIDDASSTVNDLLMTYIYNKDNKLTFKSYAGWLKAGFQVNRGEKGFLLWSRPQSELLKEKNAEPDEDSNRQFFVSYVFSNEQVRPK